MLQRTNSLVNRFSKLKILTSLRALVVRRSLTHQGRERTKKDRLSESQRKPLNKGPHLKRLRAGIPGGAVGTTPNHPQATPTAARLKLQSRLGLSEKANPFSSLRQTLLPRHPASERHSREVESFLTCFRRTSKTRKFKGKKKCHLTGLCWRRARQIGLRRAPDAGSNGRRLCPGGNRCNGYQRLKRSSRRKYGPPT